MLNLSVRTKILSLIALFSLVIVGMSVSSALTSKSVSSELQSLSTQSLQLVKNLEKVVSFYYNNLLNLNAVTSKYLLLKQLVGMALSKLQNQQKNSKLTLASW